MLQLFPASNSYFMSIDKPAVVLKRFFVKYLSELRHMQSFVVAYIEQVLKIEKSKASIVEVVSCFATVKARIQERQSDVQCISSQVKSALRKFSEGKHHDCDSGPDLGGGRPHERIQNLSVGDERMKSLIFLWVVNIHDIHTKAHNLVTSHLLTQV